MVPVRILSASQALVFSKREEMIIDDEKKR